MTYLLEIIHHVLPEAFFDVLKTVPLLLVVYALLYYIENRLTNTPELLSRAAQFGPVVGALAGSIPQCGFSAAASALFSAGFLAPATLVAVFLATSDEAVPIMLAGGASVQQVVLLLDHCLKLGFIALERIKGASALGDIGADGKHTHHLAFDHQRNVAHVQQRLLVRRWRQREIIFLQLAIDGVAQVLRKARRAVGA